MANLHETYKDVEDVIKEVDAWVQRRPAIAKKNTREQLVELVAVEYGELRDAIKDTKGNLNTTPEVLEEAADVVFLLLQLAKRSDIDLAGRANGLLYDTIPAQQVEPKDLENHLNRLVKNPTSPELALVFFEQTLLFCVCQNIDIIGALRLKRLFNDVKYDEELFKEGMSYEDGRSISRDLEKRDGIKKSLLYDLMKRYIAEADIQPQTQLTAKRLLQ